MGTSIQKFLPFLRQDVVALTYWTQTVVEVISSDACLNGVTALEGTAAGVTVLEETGVGVTGLTRKGRRGRNGRCGDAATINAATNSRLNDSSSFIFAVEWFHIGGLTLYRCCYGKYHQLYCAPFSN